MLAIVSGGSVINDCNISNDANYSQGDTLLSRGNQPDIAVPMAHITALPPPKLSLSAHGSIGSECAHQNPQA
jgi:hypothetical protein